MDVKQVLAIKAELGEHPVWRAEDRSLYWLDIEAAKFNRFDPGSGENTSWDLPDKPGCFAFGHDGTALVALRDGLYRLVLPAGSMTRAIAAAHPAHLRFNDGKTDRQGRLWIGTSRVDNDVRRTDENAYYRYDGHRLDKMLTDVGVTNGTAFSGDGRTLYRAQTETRQIWSYDYDPASGTPSRQRLFATISDEFGLPDGATVDTDGGYWVAMATPPDGGRAGIARFTPDGRMDFFVDMPVPLTTMPTFGGPDLSTLYITTARLEAFMPYETPEIAGSIFAIETGFTGVVETPLRAG